MVLGAFQLTGTMQTSLITRAQLVT